MIKKDTTKFQYSPNQIRKVIRKSDFWKYKLDKDQLITLTESIATEFAENNSETKGLETIDFRHKKIFITNNIYDTLTIRKTSEILESLFHVNSFSREQEILQLKYILETEKSFSIVRTDIKNFFESISFYKIISLLQTKGIYNNSFLLHLNNIKRELDNHGHTSLPRGLALSSTLSEIYLEEFDNLIRSNRDILYYSRYVDDIVIITKENSQKKILDFIKLNLPEGLILNRSKTRFYHSKSTEKINYLGYSLDLSNALKIGISKNKLGKIKKRIILSLKQFIKDSNFEILLLRIKFLTGATELRIADRAKKLVVGIKYQYALCDESEIQINLKELDNFWYSVLVSKKYYISNKLRAKLTTENLIKLKQMSFKSGYSFTITNSLNPDTISKIQEVWKYE
ncbi:maturase [Leptospira kobayashii]|uniref:Maturase n=1 Tax=Leptospira kobayashii TaxID=1917830 RepID=A0ABN6KG64_9LEPT|nr:antiviral reverse transcriptase Drt3a [Leptospira kobayashii]BDA80195.1 maturase [Leptospira kobayashii]